MTSSRVTSGVPFKKVQWLSRDIDVTRRDDGSIILQSRHALRSYAPNVPALLSAAADQVPDRIWLAQRRGATRSWRTVSYSQGKRTVDALTQAILDLKLPSGSPIALLSGNSIEHGLLTLAAMQAQRPPAPISPSYSLASHDHSKLKYVMDLIRPGAIFVQSGVQFEAAINALELRDVPIIHVDEPSDKVASIAYAGLVKRDASPDVEGSLREITPDSIGKFLLTSGSTGLPKAVVNTHRMMCANVAMSQQCRIRRPGQVVLDWLPWNHTMGGNMMFNSVMADLGTLYIDDGRPPPGPFEETLRNLKEISPTYFVNVPAGYSALISAMEADDVLAEKFFKNLEVLTYGGAALSEDLYARMQKLAVRWTGSRIVFYTGWGSTETAPTAASTYWNNEGVGLVGLPHPGVEMKLVPIEDKFELRLRAITVTPGYHGQPDLTEAAFDEEGFYKIGDAGRFVDKDDPSAGIRFAGRIAEDFKLSTGTFVHSGPLRTAAVSAASPVLRDAVVTGQDRHFVGLLVWLDTEACRQLAGLPDGRPEELAKSGEILSILKAGLAQYNDRAGGSSTRIARILILHESPSIEAGEITDKGYVNQRAVATRRAEAVERLYADVPDADVIVLTA